MFCPDCNQHYDSGKFCPECGTTLIDDAPASSGAAFGVGDYAAIEGGIHLSDSHNVHHEDRSVHNITNTTSTVNNITQVAAQKTDSELLQERKTTYLNACKRAYEDNVLEQHEVLELEELRIKLNLDKTIADAILDSVRGMSERGARKTDLSPIAKIKLKALTNNLKKNEIKALIDQIDSLEPLVRKFDHDELSRKYFLVLAALKSERCIELYETSMVDSYWKSFWSYLAYIKQGQLTKAEDVLISLDRFTEYPEDNVSVLAVAGALMMGNKADAKIYLNELTGEHTPALQRFVDSLYLLLEPNTAKEMGADENTCAFYLVNFFGQKDPKAKAEEERLRKQKQEADRKKEEALKKAEAERKAKEEAERKAKEEAERKAKEEAERKAKEETERKAKEADGGKHKTNVQYQNGHDYVDLGLPSGTLWATCNIGASKPEDFGNYFAWGETTGYDEGKREFDDQHYKFLKKKWGLLGSKWIYTKYCDDKKYGIADEKRFLDDEDDAAFVLWGKDWRMPTAEQVQELINENNTSCKAVNQNGIDGLLITSKTNGNSIFLPKAGSHEYSYELSSQKIEWGRYWTKERPTRSSSVFSLSFYIFKSFIGLSYIIDENPARNRCFGYCIRPVRSK